jgi:hypothetical protein
MRLIFIFLLSLMLAACAKENSKIIAGKQYSVKTTESKKDTVPQTYASKNDSFYVSKIKTTIIKDFLKDMTNDIPKDKRRFYYTAVDINGDSLNEYFIAFANSYFCGSGGCTVLLLNSEFKLKQSFTVVAYPIIILKDKTKGWNDLLMYSADAPHVLKHIRGNYPDNPSVEPVYKGKIDNDLPYLFDDLDKSTSYEF